MSAITLAAALEAVRLGEATQAHAAVLAHGLEEREADVHARVRAGYDRTIADTWREEVSRRDIEIVALRAQRDAALEEQRRAVARVAELSAERDRLLAVVVAQADAIDAWYGTAVGDAATREAWAYATSATEALGRELRASAADVLVDRAVTDATQGLDARRPLRDAR